MSQPPHRGSSGLLGGSDPLEITERMFALLGDGTRVGLRKRSYYMKTEVFSFTSPAN